MFIPSSIAAFGATTPREMTPDETITRPNTVYGITKVYSEMLGDYYARRYDVDFRSLRYPGPRVMHPTLSFAAAEIRTGQESSPPVLLVVAQQTVRPDASFLVRVANNAPDAVDIYFAALKTGKYTCFLKPDTERKVLSVAPAARPY